jgi:small subunit ribosomal protein S4
MGRYTGPTCRLCRREGTQLYLKGHRCFGGKCKIESPPGMHNWRKGKLSEFGKRLREKQKVKRYYGIYEKQFKNYFGIASKQKGNTGENLLVILERRLDNVVCRGQFAHTRASARQLIAHGHLLVNGKKVDIPSYLVKAGDVISTKAKENSKNMVVRNLENPLPASVPSWLEVDKETPAIKVAQLPNRDEVQIEIQEQMIVEFCSR